MAKMSYEEFANKYPNSANTEDYSRYVQGDEDSGTYSSTDNQQHEDAMAGIGETAAVDYDKMYEAMASMYGKISSMNEEKFSRYWPESMQQGISAAKTFDIAGQEQAAQATAFNQSIADNMNNWLANLTKHENVFMREEAGKSNEWIKGQIRDVNKFNAEEFYGALETAMPGLQDTVSDYKKTVDQMLSGQLPDAVKDEIEQAAAERGQAAGIYGPSLENAQLRDLGINRLQYLQAGQGQMGQLTGIAGQMMAPLATPNIYQNVMMTPTPYAPQPTYAQPSNVAGIAGNYLSAIMGQTMMQPQAGIGAAVQMGGVQAQINQANTQLQYSKAMGGLQYQNQQQMMGLYQQQIAQQQAAAQSQASSGLFNSILGAAGTIGGGLLGGPFGSMLGGALFSGGGGGGAGFGSALEELLN